MTRLTTKALDRIEKRMENVEEGSIRHCALKSAKNFKTSWMELGRALYSVWKDKLYRQWGYMTFDAYTSKEIGIKKATSMKLLKSYYFLEKEEPSYLSRGADSNADAASAPNYEAVNLLRLAKNRPALDRVDYERIKRDVLEMGKDTREVKRDLVTMMRQRQALEPDEARKARRVAVIKRVLTALKTLKTNMEVSRILPISLIKETSDLINKIEAELE